MKRLVEFPLENGGTVLVEVAEPEQGGLVPASRGRDVVVKAQQTLQQALGKLQPTAEAIISQLKGLSEQPSEIEVEFGLKLSAEAGAVLAAAGAEANYNIKLVWKNEV